MKQRSHLNACLAALPLLLAGCDRPAAEQNAVILAPNQAAPAVEQAAPARPTNASVDVVERVPAASLTPDPHPTPAPKMQTRKDFTDPPLPPELNQDGGLKPLPPRPH